MPVTWVYVVGGIIVGVIGLLIGYNLIMNVMILSEKQNILHEFSKLQTSIETTCSEGTIEFIRVKLPDSVRVIYATEDEDVTTTLPEVVDKIKNKEVSRGDNICLQFKNEKTEKCQKLKCNFTLPYLGVLSEQMDIEIMVKKILGQAPSKEYNLFLVKNEEKEVEGIVKEGCVAIVKG